MLDFMMVATRTTKSCVEVFPKFKALDSKDLMIRGGDFYAIWDEERKMWSLKEGDVVRLVDKNYESTMKNIANNLERMPM